MNPHLHLLALDGAYHEQGTKLAWQALGHLKTSEVGEVLERAVRRMEKHLRRRSLLLEDDGADSGAEGDADPESNLAASCGLGPGGARRAPVDAWARASRTPRARVRQGPVRQLAPAQLFAAYYEHRHRAPPPKELQ